MRRRWSCFDGVSIRLFIGFQLFAGPGQPVESPHLTRFGSDPRITLPASIFANATTKGLPEEEGTRSPTNSAETSCITGGNHRKHDIYSCRWRVRFGEIFRETKMHLYRPLSPTLSGAGLLRNALIGFVFLLGASACSAPERQAATASEQPAATTQITEAVAPGPSNREPARIHIADKPPAKVSTDPAPSVYLVYFTASWCPNCKVLTPKLAAAEAALRAKNAPVEVVYIDASNAQTLAASEKRLPAKRLNGIYDLWSGITGLVVLAAADNGEPIDCLNRQFSADAIEKFALNAITRVRDVKPGERFGPGLICPPPNEKRT